MSRKENHRYLRRAVVHAVFNHRARLTWRSTAVTVGLFIVLLFTVQGRAAMQLIVRTPQWVFISVVTAVIMGIVFAVGRARRRRARLAYLRAFQEPDARGVVAVIDETMAAVQSMMADADAFTAHSRAVAYALYGEGEAAMRELTRLEWTRRAPLVQTAGVSAEGVVAMLCDDDAEHALALVRRAQKLAQVSAGVPGAKTTRRAHDTFVAVAEALAQGGNPDVALLEERAADGSYPVMQVLGAFGLAVALERRGEKARAAEVRAFLDATAPHCAPLHR